MFTLALSLSAALLAPAAAPRAEGYAKPELLIEAADLPRFATEGSVRILDCRGKGKYLDGHVPGARWLDAITWMRTFGEGADREAWAKRIGDLGIDTGTKVVVYDDSRAKDAARMWWILRYWGVKDVRLLNGGWAAWQATDGPVDRTKVRPTPVEAKLTPQPGRLATRAQVAALLGGKAQIVDARSADEFCGIADTAKRNGAIPGAVHLEWSETVDRRGRFKSAAELSKLFQDAGIDPTRPAVTYCQSGGRAAVMAFALELMGGKDVRNYYRSWNEWGNAEDAPVVKPKPKKD
jgi:thiosulfate/3-mercaptopyruvate sulfurtransferase